jgi:hypothetical protein
LLYKTDAAVMSRVWAYREKSDCEVVPQREGE